MLVEETGRNFKQFIDLHNIDITEYVKFDFYTEGHSTKYKL